MVDSANAKENNGDNLNHILDNIKEVMSGKTPNIEVLELTEKVEANLNVPPMKPSLGQGVTHTGNEELRKAGLLDRQATNNQSQPQLRSGASLEEIVIELVKPQLSLWLNQNLPSIVNNIVQNEIKKIMPQDE